MESVAELAREAGLSPLVTRNEAAFARFAALHIKELCAGEEPVYQLRYTDGRFPAYWTELTELDYQHRDPREGCEFRILYPASTVAALKARVAELETALQRLVDNLAEGEFISLTRIDEAREALRSKK
jgi:hypothetical protein